MKKIYLFGNWKMNMTLKDSAAYSDKMRQILAANPKLKEDTEICVFPPYILIPAVASSLKSISDVGSQNASEYEAGAYTGEVSTKMLLEQGAKYAIVGHSERRHIYGESSRQVNKKALRCIADGLIPVICVGETLEEREAGKTLSVINEQLMTAVEGIAADARYLIAYEPVWAIGTGRAASASDAEEVCAFIKSQVQAPVLYGGSVKPANAAEIFSRSSIDGGLIGGASLKADEFLDILKNYRASCQDL